MRNVRLLTGGSGALVALHVGFLPSTKAKPQVMGWVLGVCIAATLLPESPRQMIDNHEPSRKIPPHHRQIAPYPARGTHNPLHQRPHPLRAVWGLVEIPLRRYLVWAWECYP
ncbi:uncharacterized protein B0H64DRAFT_381409 [Chaetomium fimeti]|uniref:Uncharacterized protein n=1 Tax=Chaetomium fimeti TaxID=1854472 RepID=A0AAE0HQL5_9PEZI|nr:hypothetical protein B0H64DRAFT_381409 [Chaetomium fimeti]